MNENVHLFDISTKKSFIIVLLKNIIEICISDLHILCKIGLFFMLLIKYDFFLRSTAELESYHNHILMYCSKRFAYTPPALDYNNNVDRQPLKNKDGTAGYLFTYYLNFTLYTDRMNKKNQDIRYL